MVRSPLLRFVPFASHLGIYQGNLEIVALSESGQPRGRSLANHRTSIDIGFPALRPVTCRAGTAIQARYRHCRRLAAVSAAEFAAAERHLSHMRQRRIATRASSSNQAPLVGAVQVGAPPMIGPLSRLERKAIEMVDRVWVCSHREEDRLHRRYRIGIPVTWCPWNSAILSPGRTARLSSNERRVPGNPIRRSFRISAQYGRGPTIGPRHHLARRAATSRGRLILAGRFPPPTIEHLPASTELNASRTRRLSAFLRGEYRHSAAMGGTRMKILEAMAWGLPVVANTGRSRLELTEHDFLF